MATKKEQRQINRDNRRTVKQVDKGGLTQEKVDRAGKPVNGKPGFYDTEEAPSGLNKIQTQRWNEQKAVYDKGKGTGYSVSNALDNAMNAGKDTTENEPEATSENWRDRVKNGTASDDDMLEAYKAMQNGTYSPGEKTKAYFDSDEFKNANPDLFGTNEETEETTESENVPNKKDEIDANVKKNKDERKSLGSYDKQNKERYEGKTGSEGRDEQSTALSQKFNQNVGMGEGEYTNLPTEGAKAIKAMGNYVNTKNNDENVKELTEDEKQYRTWKNGADQTFKNEAKVRKELPDSIKAAQKKNQEDQDKVDKIMRGRVEKSVFYKKAQQMADDVALENNAYAQFLKDNGEDPEQWSSEVAAIGNALKEENPEIYESFTQLQSERSKLQDDIDMYEAVLAKKNISIEDWESIGANTSTLKKLKEEGQEISSDLISINTKNLDNLSLAVAKYGTDEQRELFNQVQSFYSSFQEDTGMELNQESYQQVLDGLKDIKAAIRDEIKNDIDIGDARREMVNSFNKFMFFAVDDLITAVSLYYTLDIGNPADVIGKFSQLGQRNKAMNEAETNFKTGLINNEAENVKRDQTAQSQADYNAIQNNVELQKYLQQKGIDSEDVVREMQALRKAYQQYQTYNDGGFEAFYTAKMLQDSNNNGIAGLLTSAVQAGALNLDSLKSLITGEKPTSSDENLKTDVVDLSQKTKGMTNNMMDNAMNNAKTQTEEEPQGPDPAVRADKQQVVNASLQQRQANPGKSQGQAQGPAPAKGWGKK